MAFTILHLLVLFRPIITAFMIWPVMYGKCAPIGLVKIITSLSAVISQFPILRAPQSLIIRPNLLPAKELYAAEVFCAMILIVPVTEFLQECLLRKTPA